MQIDRRQRERRSRSCVQCVRVPLCGGPVAARLRKFVARLHPHPVVGGAPADVLQRQRHVRGHARLAVQQAGQRSPLAPEPCRRLGHVPAYIVHAPADEFTQVRRVLHRADALARNVVHGQHSVRSVIVDRVHVHGLAALEAEHYAPVARHANAPLARTVAPSTDAAGSRARRSCLDASPLADGTGYAEAVARDRRGAAPRRRGRAAPAGPCA